MDRLVCGDVGFGKTEVALRGAFAAALSGQQVAVVCPTTLLARQHFANFRDRFAGLPVEVRQLSRLVTASEAKATREGLAEGTVDIVVGTHAILAKSVEFKRLGLVIVDEEQRFGVTAKERLKNLKADVHVLTLTATPIPRTLQMALTGLRELSIIATPPVDRLAVRTYVMPWDEVVLREALLREHYRGGQSFFVTPKIADLPDIEEFLRKSVPEVTLRHRPRPDGAVRGRGADERLLRPPLRCPAVDHHRRERARHPVRQHDDHPPRRPLRPRPALPAARPGRAQQDPRLRLYDDARRRAASPRPRTSGCRCWRSSTASARASSSPPTTSTSAAPATCSATSSRGISARSASNCTRRCWRRRSTPPAPVRAGEPVREEGFSPTITLDAPILIPEDYVPDLNLRMALYRRLNELEDRGAIDAFAAEMIDRFGPLPPEVANLVQVIEIKLHCVAAHIAKLDAGAKGALVTFQNDQFPNGGGLMDYVARLGERARFRPDQKLFVAADWGAVEARLKGALTLASALAKIAGGAVVKPAEPKAAKPAKSPAKSKPMPARPSVFKAKVRS